MRLAVIPARGGSRRIHRKNLVEFAGKPMIAHSIQAAIDSAAFDRIVVSTDDAEIADVSKLYGAEAPFTRPAALADDYTGTTPVIAHAVRALAAEGGFFSQVCCIYATAPFVRPGDLLQGLQLLESGVWQYVFSATSYPFPVLRALRELRDGGVEMLFPEHSETRSQDLPEFLHDAGQFYWGTERAWLGECPIYGPQSTIVRLPRWRVQDIDTMEDLQRARYMFKVMTETQ
jgi:N-acylneuraminate cytidylyltransferase